MKSDVGDKIKTLRKFKGYTLEQMADWTDSSKSYIWEIENHKVPSPSLDKLSRIAKVLGVSVIYFIEDDVTEEDATDRMFYKTYRQLPAQTKKKVRETVEIWAQSNNYGLSA